MTPHASEYLGVGWQVTQLVPGTKRPASADWNQPNVPLPAAYNGHVGLLHAYSGTCALDVDQLDKARTWLAQHGVDLDQLLDALDAVAIDSGKPNRAKLLFKLSTPMPSVKVTDDAGAVVFELRCGTADGKSVQDVLPPARHPDGGTYAWKCGPLAHWSVPPPLPSELRDVWNTLLDRQAPAAAGGDILDTFRARTEHSPAEAAAMLKGLSADGYDAWVRVGQALQHQFGDAGFDLWRDWSATSDKFPGDDALRDKWASFGRNSRTPVTFRSILDMVKPAAKAAPAETGPSIVGPTAARFSDAEITTPAPEPPHIVRGYILQDAGGFVGPGGTGKTTVSLYEAPHVILGRPLWGRNVDQPGAVLWITAEDSREMVLYRLQRICLALGLSAADTERVRANFFVEDWSTRPVRLLTARRDGTLAPTATVDDLIAAYKTEGIVYTHLDPVSLLGAGEVHGNDGFAELWRTNRRIARELHCGVRAVHHVSQAVARGGISDQYAGRGGTAWADNSRFQHQLAVVTERVISSEAGKFRLPPEVLDHDIAQGRVLTITAHKISYAARDRTPIFLRRDGFAFRQISVAQEAEGSGPTADELAHRRAAIAALVERKAAEGVRLSRRDVEDYKAQLGMSRDALRASINEMLQTGALREVPLPPGEVKGQRKHHLATDSTTGRAEGTKP